LGCRESGGAHFKGSQSAWSAGNRGLQFAWAGVLNQDNHGYRRQRRRWKIGNSKLEEKKGVAPLQARLAKLRLGLARQ